MVATSTEAPGEIPKSLTPLSFPQSITLSSLDTSLQILSLALLASTIAFLLIPIILKTATTHQRAPCEMRNIRITSTMCSRHLSF